MTTRWTTVRDIAEARHNALTEAQALSDGARCPKVFRASSTLSLL